jgi:deoxyribose-phosphate aldolase
MFEHVILSPTATVETMLTSLESMRRGEVVAVTIPPFWVKKMHRDRGEPATGLLATMVGYPYGHQRTETKQTEVEWALKDGADEIQVVFNSSAWFSNSNGWPKVELAKLGKLIHSQERFFTVVIETHFYDEVQLSKAIKVAIDAGADLIQNATGTLQVPFDEPKVQLFRELTGQKVGCKVGIDGASRQQIVTWSGCAN